MRSMFFPFGIACAEGDLAAEPRRFRVLDVAQLDAVFGDARDLDCRLDSLTIEHHGAFALFQPDDIQRVMRLVGVEF